MKIHGVKRKSSHPIFVNFKKHYCLSCNALLKKTKVSRVVNSDSYEAKDYDFSAPDGFMKGNIKFIFTQFSCPKCGKSYSVEELYSIYKAGRKG